MSTDVLDYATAAAGNAYHRTHRNILATASWARRQPWQRLAWFVGLTVAAVVVALTLLRLLAWALTGLWDLAFVADPPAPETPDAPPQWAVEFGQSPFWPALADNITTYVHQQATATGLPTGILPVAWLVLGGVLLVMAWLPLQHRTPSLIAWWGWLAATCWQLYTLTPGDSPLPALLTAGIGVLLSLTPAVAFFGPSIVLGLYIVIAA